MQRYNGLQNLSHEYSDEERLFLMALDRYKREARRPHPTFAEVFAVANGLGYRRVVEPEEPYLQLIEEEHASTQARPVEGSPRTP